MSSARSQSLKIYSVESSAACSALLRLASDARSLLTALKLLAEAVVLRSVLCLSNFNDVAIANATDLSLNSCSAPVRLRRMGLATATGAIGTGLLGLTEADELDDLADIEPLVGSAREMGKVRPKTPWRSVSKLGLRLATAIGATETGLLGLTSETELVELAATETLGLATATALGRTSALMQNSALVA